jgi:hypothetical protein
MYIIKTNTVPYSWHETLATSVKKIILVKSEKSQPQKEHLPKCALNARPEHVREIISLGGPCFCMLQ